MDDKWPRVKCIKIFCPLKDAILENMLSTRALNAWKIQATIDPEFYLKQIGLIHKGAGTKISQAKAKIRISRYEDPKRGRFTRHKRRKKGGESVRELLALFKPVVSTFICFFYAVNIFFYTL